MITTGTNLVAMCIEAAKREGVEVTMHRDNGLFVFMARRIGSKHPPGTSFTVKDLTLCTVDDLNKMFSYMVANTLHCDDAAPRTEWRAV